jgi:hypothetical protein
MRFVALVMVCLSTVASMSVAHSATVTRWRADWQLVGTDDKNCGAQHTTKEELELVDGPTVTLRIIPATSGVRRDLRLMDPLNADGSGKVRALTDRGRVGTLEFAAGTGPRMVRFNAPYSICSYIWTPIE